MSRCANLAYVGDCVKIVGGPFDAELEVVGCGAADAGYKVMLEPEMSEECPPGPEPLVYPKPPLTICLAAQKGAATPGHLNGRLSSMSRGSSLT